MIDRHPQRLLHPRPIQIPRPIVRRERVSARMRNIVGTVLPALEIQLERQARGGIGGVLAELDHGLDVTALVGVESSRGGLASGDLREDAVRFVQLVELAGIFGAVDGLDAVGVVVFEFGVRGLLVEGVNAACKKRS